MKRKPIKPSKREVIVVQLHKPLTRLIISNRIKAYGDTPKRRGAFSDLVRSALRRYLDI